MVVKGTAYEFFFSQSDDPTRQRIWTERMEPYFDRPDYPKVIIQCNFKIEIHG